MAIYLIEPAAQPTYAYDYSSHYSTMSGYLSNIASSLATINTSLNTIETNSTTTAEKLTILATQTTTIASKQTAMETYFQRIKELAEGTGVHIIGPWDWVGLVALYKIFIEEGKILDTSDDVSEDQIAQARVKLNSYISKIRSMPVMTEADNESPTVSSVKYEKDYSAWSPYDPVVVEVQFTEVVVVDGVVSLTFANGDSVQYSSGTGTNILRFNYTPTSGKSTRNLSTATSNALSGNIKDLAGNSIDPAGCNNVILSGSPT